MPKEKKKAIRNNTHSLNKNKEKYDLSTLIEVNPTLSNYLTTNHKGENTIDFSNTIAIKTLNQTLLHHYYGIKYWDFPSENLCPSIPNRADYIHYIADTLKGSNFGKLPEGEKITCLDIGTGSTCIYPIIGVIEYNWNFIASDINPKSIESSQNIIKKNEVIANKIECRLQEKPTDILYGVLKKEEEIDLVICNPPFYTSIKDAEKGTQKKSAPYNASEINPEIICDGGENRFLQHFAKESKKFSNNCYWFSALVKKTSNQKGITELLTQLGATEIKTIPTGSGNKSSQILAWSFITKDKQKTWRETKWRSKK